MLSCRFIKCFSLCFVLISCAAYGQPASSLTDGLKRSTNLDRHVAQWALNSPDCSVSYTVPGKKGEVLRFNVRTIPADLPFRLKAVINGPLPQSAAEWKVLSRLKHLERIGFATRFDVSDKDVKSLASLRWPALTWVSIWTYNNKSLLTDAGVKTLSSMKRINRLYLGGGSLTDESFNHLLKMKALRHLTLSSTGPDQFSTAGYKTLAKHSGLNSLDLIGRDLNDNKLAAVVKLKGLSSLSIRGSFVTAKGLELLREARRLTRVVSFQSNYGATEVKAIAANAPNLTRLELHQGKSLTDDALAEVVGMNKLAELYIGDGSKLTNAGLFQLTKSRSLRRLVLVDISDDSKIDADGVRKFKASRISVEVVGPSID